MNRKLGRASPPGWFAPIVASPTGTRRRGASFSPGGGRAKALVCPRRCSKAACGLLTRWRARAGQPRCGAWASADAAWLGRIGDALRASRLGGAHRPSRGGESGHRCSLGRPMDDAERCTAARARRLAGRTRRGPSRARCAGGKASRERAAVARASRAPAGDSEAWVGRVLLPLDEPSAGWRARCAGGRGGFLRTGSRRASPLVEATRAATSTRRVRHWRIPTETAARDGRDRVARRAVGRESAVTRAAAAFRASRASSLSAGVQQRATGRFGFRGASARRGPTTRGAPGAAPHDVLRLPGRRRPPWARGRTSPPRTSAARR